MGVRLGGGGCPSSAPNSYISAIFHLKSPFSLADIFWYARSTSLLSYTKKHPRRCWPSWWVHFLVHWAQSGRSLSMGWEEYTPLLCLPLQIVCAGCICLQCSPFSTHGLPSTRVVSPAPWLFATQHFFPAHSPGDQGWAVRPCIWGDIPPGYACYSPSLPPLQFQSTYWFLLLWTCLSEVTCLYLQQQ